MQTLENVCSTFYGKNKENRNIGGLRHRTKSLTSTKFSLLKNVGIQAKVKFLFVLNCSSLICRFFYLSVSSVLGEHLKREWSPLNCYWTHVNNCIDQLIITKCWSCWAGRNISLTSVHEGNMFIFKLNRLKPIFYLFVPFWDS